MLKDLKLNGDVNLYDRSVRVSESSSDLDGDLSSNDGVDLNMKKDSSGFSKGFELPPPPPPAILETPPAIVVEAPPRRSPIDIYNDFNGSFQGIFGPISGAFGNRRETEEQSTTETTSDDN